jgi:hypothetical protein
MTVVRRRWTLVSVLLTADPQETHMARQRDVRTDLDEGMRELLRGRPSDLETAAAATAAPRRGPERVYEFTPELDRGRRGAR